MISALLSGRGRLDRLGYLLALLVVGLLFCIPVGVMAPTPLAARLDALNPALVRLAVVGGGTLFWGLALWVYCAATARRLHDMDRSGWLAWLALVPAIGLGALTVVLLLSRGSDGANRYGARWL